jgi:hypothetical protein
MNLKNSDDMIEYIINIDKDDNKYLEMMKQPWFTGIIYQTIIRLII